MEHFYNFPQIVYDSDANITLTNIFVRGRIKEKILSNEISYYNYHVRDGDKPEIIADKYYGHTRYTWLILYANNIIDPQFDWPLTNVEFIRYLDKKYNTGSQQEYEVIASLQSTIHHYENNKGQVVLQANAQGNPGVSIFDYEQTLNESKREIKVIDSKFLFQVVEEFNKLFK